MADYDFSIDFHVCSEALSLLQYDALYQGLPKLVSEEGRLSCWDLLCQSWCYRVLQQIPVMANRYDNIQSDKAAGVPRLTFTAPARVLVALKDVTLVRQHCIGCAKHVAADPATAQANSVLWHRAQRLLQWELYRLKQQKLCMHSQAGTHVRPGALLHDSSDQPSS